MNTPTGSVIGIVPARGGSKRIPRKNIRPFHGRPLIVRSVETMLDSGVFERIIVSTDDDEIISAARSAGAEVPFVRPAALADDSTGTGAVIRHALSALEADLPVGAPPLGEICLMYPTAVFVTPNDLRASLAQLRRSDADYVFAATTFAAPIQRALVRDAHGRCSMLSPEHLLTRSQDLQTTYHDVGQFYWGRRDAWAAGIPVMTGKSEIYEIPNWRVRDIDTLDDWRMAELLFDALNSSGTSRGDVG
jgi:pseudaminic acid cytidylyltransferase